MGADPGKGSSSPDDADTGVPLDVIPLHSTNLLTVLDEDGTVLYESPSIERLYGFDQDVLVGEPVAQYFHPDDRPRVIEAFRRVVSDTAYTVEAVQYRHERADGSYVWVESVASSDPTPDGNYVVNTRDVSERRARERELERSNERLEEFASLVSHDLRNPLTVAQARLELAREGVENDHLDAVARAHDRMTDLIDGLLTLARTGTRDPDPEAVDLAALSGTCWEPVSTEAATLDVDVDRGILADSTQLRRLLENLLRNAVEHAGPDVQVTVGQLPEGDGFYVADDGPGVDDAVREQVFERGSSTKADGTGLGLRIVEDVAEAHGWGVELTASQWGGARFEVTEVDFD